MLLFQDLCNRLLPTQPPPSLWQHSARVMLYKKGSPADPGNYRGVCIQSAALKLFMRLILHRLRTALDSHLSETQLGFRPGRNTVQALFAARRLVEEMDRLCPGESPLHLVLVDFIKAFDSVFWPALRQILALFRLPMPLIAL